MRVLNADGSTVTADGKSGLNGATFGVVEGWATAWIASIKLQVSTHLELTIL